MQEWLDHIKDTDYTDLRQRFQSRDDEQFRSAFLELYVHESLIRAGYAVTIHPTGRGRDDPPRLLGRAGPRAAVHRGDRTGIESGSEGCGAAPRSPVRLEWLGSTSRGTWKAPHRTTAAKRLVSDLQPTPKKPEARGQQPNSRAIGVYRHMGVDRIDDAPAIRKALTTKHHEYGDLNAPVRHRRWHLHSRQGPLAHPQRDVWRRRGGVERGSGR